MSDDEDDSSLIRFSDAMTEAITKAITEATKDQAILRATPEGATRLAMALAVVTGAYPSEDDVLDALRVLCEEKLA